MSLMRQDTNEIVRYDMPARIVVRDAHPDDELTLWRLAALDDRPVPRGHVLIAEVDGELAAATSVSTGRTIADPWRYTADLVTLLELRAGQGRRRATSVPVPPRGSRAGLATRGAP